MEHIETTCCNIGDIIAIDIVNACGVKLIVKDTVVNEYIKDKLVELGVEYINIYNKEDIGENSNRRNEVRDKVIASISSVKQILNDLISGKGLDYSKILDISELIYSTISKNDPITDYLDEIKKTDEYTYTHCINVAFYSMLLAKWSKLPENQIKKSILAGLLHDIGKIKVPQEILNKKGYLTKEEYEEIKKHSQYGYEILDEAGIIDKEVMDAVLLHHERIDGSGYPFGAKFDKVGLYASMVAITDVFDAMTTNRVYRRRVPPFDVFEAFLTTGDCIFDATLLRTFMNHLAPNYIGTKVVLNSGELGEIVYVPPYDITDPIIRIDSHYKNLSSTKIKIVDIL